MLILTQKNISLLSETWMMDHITKGTISGVTCVICFMSLKEDAAQSSNKKSNNLKTIQKAVRNVVIELLIQQKDAGKLSYHGPMKKAH